MSLFGSYMGDFEDDPFFGAHIRQMRHMNNMVNSMFANSPLGMMGGMGGMGGMPGLPGMGGAMGAIMGGMGPPALNAPHHLGRQDLMPYGFPSMNMNMNRMFQGMNAGLGSDPSCHSYSSSTVMTMGTGPDGRPQVYQESSSTRVAPGGVKETKKTVCDSRSGVKKIAIGHHIGERAHVMEREQNIVSGDQEERQEFINLEEEEAEDFNREFERKVSSVSQGAINYRQGHSRRHREPQLALPSSAAISSRPRIRAHTARRSYPAVTGTSSSGPNSPSQPEPLVLHERTRKRDHEPEPEFERKSKSLKPSEDDEDDEDSDVIETIEI